MTNIFFFILLMILFSLLHNSHYNSHENFINFKEHRNIYGTDFMNMLEKKGFKFINAKQYLNKHVSYDKINYKTILYSDGSIEPDDMAKIYKHCYIGLRLAKHDGTAWQVVESGLMGIKTIHNGDCPSALNYSGLESILKLIDQERKNIGTMDKNLPNKVYNYCKINPNLFKINRYFREKTGNFRQMYISNNIKFFEDKIISKNNKLKKYNDIFNPTIFFGVYNQKDLEVILNHKSKAVIIFAGSDTYYNSNDTKKNLVKKNILEKLSKISSKQFKFIATSKFIENDLNHFNIPFIRDPWYFGTLKKNPLVKGNCIYTYLPYQAKFKKKLIKK